MHYRWDGDLKDFWRLLVLPLQSFIHVHCKWYSKQTRENGYPKLRPQISKSPSSTSTSNMSCHDGHACEEMLGCQIFVSNFIFGGLYLLLRMAMAADCTGTAIWKHLLLLNRLICMRIYKIYNYIYTDSETISRHMNTLCIYHVSVRN